MITIEDFKKIELKVGQIMQAERIPGSNKLLKLTIDTGNESRTLVSGLGKSYEPEEIVGLKVIVIANLQPVTIMGVESNGMLLAVGSSSDIALLTVNKDVVNGLRVE